MALPLEFLALFLLVNLGCLLAFRSLGRHEFRKQQNLMMHTLAHIDHQLARPRRVFEAVGNGLAWMIVFSFNRKDMLAQTLADLRAHEPHLRILVVDSSTDGTREMLVAMLADGRVDKLLLNRDEQLPQWQKAFALAQALELLSLEHTDYIGWIDDDMRVNRPFVGLCADLLKNLGEHRVALVSLLVDEMQTRNHPVLETLVVGDVEVQIKESFPGAFVFAPVALFAELGLPPVEEGVNNVCIEDSYYSRLLLASGRRVAAIDASTHLGYRQSHRRPMHKR